MNATDIKRMVLLIVVVSALGSRISNGMGAQWQPPIRCGFRNEMAEVAVKPTSSTILVVYYVA